MIRKKINKIVLSQVICYVILAITIIYLIVTKKYKNYITPRMLPYLYFTVVVLIIWAISNIRHLFSIVIKPRYLQCFVLIIPTALIIISLFNINTNVKKGFSHNTSIKNSYRDMDIDDSIEDVKSEIDESTLAENNYDFPDNDENDNKNATENENDVAKSTEGDYASKVIKGLKLHGYDDSTKSIIISDEEFYNWTVEIFSYPNDFIGYEINYKGQVMLPPEEFFEADKISIVRQLMTCCVADLVPIGFICQSDNIDTLEQDTWISVTGKLFMGEFNNEKDIQINITNIEYIDPLEEPYVYPY